MNRWAKMALAVAAIGCSSEDAHRIQQPLFWAQSNKLIASDATDDALFGSAVAFDADTAVIGAFGPGNLGSAYVFVRSGATWSEQQKLTASDAIANEAYAANLAVHGDTAAVSAFDHDLPAIANAGAVYVFTRSGTTWSEQQKLVALDATAGDQLGMSVSVSGDTLVSGAPGDDAQNTTDSGSAYVFVRNGTVWTQQAKLIAADDNDFDTFGTSVSVDGDTAIVGAGGDDHPGLADAGSAYVFVRNGTTWTQQQKLLASDGGAGDYFGSAVSVQGDTAVVSAHFDTIGGMIGVGSVYVFVRNGTTWSEQQKLTAQNGMQLDQFGTHVDVDGDRAIVAVSNDDQLGEDAGAAYVFRRTGTTWTTEQKLLAADGASSDRFGEKVALSGSAAIAGAPNTAHAGGVGAGAVYVFTLLGGPCARAAECSSGFCVDGVCCENACAGSCDICAAAGSEGQCLPIAAGEPGDPSCAPYVCDGLIGDCPASCSSADECVQGAICDENGACVGLGEPGTQCSLAGQCASGFCVDGVCCDSDCTGECAHCDLAGSEGICTIVDCAPYRCDEGGGTCLTECLSTVDCVEGHICDADGRCIVPAGAAPPEGGGCSCRLGRRAPNGALLLLLALATLTWVRPRYSRKTARAAGAAGRSSLG